MMKLLNPTTLALAAIAAALSLGACQRNDDGRTAGEKVDSAVAKADQKAAEIRSDMKQESRDAKDTMNRAVDSASVKMKDASITTAVNAELARDSELSALRINVDTDSGKVVLRGTAPSDSSRARATTLASRVEGVVSVDNQLSVGKG